MSAMRRVAILVALVLIAAACGGSDSDPSATTTDPDATTGTTAQGTTGASADDGTTTTSDLGSGTAEFVISRVVFGDEGYVSITNVGGAPGNLDGWNICQRPAYYRIDSVEVAPGETVHFTDGAVAGLTGQAIDANGRFGSLQASGGEVGLYVDNSFGSAASIRSYVEWGSPGHGRSSVAVEAGIWTDGGFVPADGAPGLAAVVDNPVAPADWATS